MKTRKPLQRKTPLKASSKPMKAGTKTPAKNSGGLKNTKPLARKTPLKSSSTLNPGKGLQAKTPLKAGKGLQTKTALKTGTSKTKRRGLGGHGRTAVDVAFHGRVAQLGCQACKAGGMKQHHPQQIHHPEGRSRGQSGDYKERYVIGLCAEHHDQRIYSGYDNGSRWVGVDKNIPSVHHNGKGFAETYGSERWLVHEVYQQLNECPPWFEEGEWGVYRQITKKAAQESWLAEALAPGKAGQRRSIVESKKSEAKSASQTDDSLNL